MQRCRNDEGPLLHGYQRCLLWIVAQSLTPEETFMEIKKGLNQNLAYTAGAFARLEASRSEKFRTNLAAVLRLKKKASFAMLIKIQLKAHITRKLSLFALELCRLFLSVWFFNYEHNLEMNPEIIRGWSALGVFLSGNPNESDLIFLLLWVRSLFPSNS